jgi:hypothetical protein
MIQLKFTSINKNNINELCIAFEFCLLEHDLTFTYTDMIEKDGIISFLFCNDPEKARSVEFDGQHCMGLDTEYIAKEVLEPVLPRLKAYARVK